MAGFFVVSIQVKEMKFIELTLCESCAEGHESDKISINVDHIKSFNQQNAEGTFIEMHQHNGVPVGWKVKESYSEIKRCIKNLR